MLGSNFGHLLMLCYNRLFVHFNTLCFDSYPRFLHFGYNWSHVTSAMWSRLSCIREYIPILGQKSLERRIYTYGRFWKLLKDSELYFRLDIDLLIVYNYKSCSQSMTEEIVQVGSIISSLNSMETVWNGTGSPAITLSMEKAQISSQELAIPWYAFCLQENTFL